MQPITSIKHYNSSPPRPVPPLAVSAKVKYLMTSLAGIGLWFALYWQLHRLAEFLAFSLLGLTPGSHLGEAVLFSVP